MVLLVLVSTCRLVWLNLVETVPAPKNEPFKVQESLAIAAEFDRRYPGVLYQTDLLTDAVRTTPDEICCDSNHGKIFVAPCQLVGPKYTLPADIDLRQWSSLFKPRNYKRTVATLQAPGSVYPKDSSVMWLIFPGRIPDDWDNRYLVLLARIHVFDEKVQAVGEKAVLEGIALLPRCPSNGEIQYHQALVPHCPTHSCTQDLCPWPSDE
jgi:hypothetical protein